MISTKGRYALRVMIDIAIYSNGEYVRLKEVSEREEISIKYLEQVISLLAKANLVVSLRGNNGGYKLTKKVEEYTAGEILRAAEGTLSSVNCLAGENNGCDRQGLCSTLDFWKGYNKVIDDYVDSITLEDLVKKAKVNFSNDYVI